MILVTGSSGFVGKNIVKVLNDKNVPVVKFNRGDSLDFIPKEYDTIINCAAEIHNLNFEQIYKTNVELTYNLLTKLKYKQFIQIGSSSEYGNGRVNYPFDFYSGTKAAASDLVLGCGHTVIRPQSLYGANDRKTKFIPVLLDKLSKNEEVTIYEGSHDWVYIDDFINAIMTIIFTGQNGQFDVGTCKTTTNFEVCLELASIMNSKSKILRVFKPYRDYDRDSWKLESTSTYPASWTPLYNLKEGLTKCLENYSKES